jgi:hypothetical protein
MRIRECPIILSQIKTKTWTKMRKLKTINKKLEDQILMIGIKEKSLIRLLIEGMVETQSIERNTNHHHLQKADQMIVEAIVVIAVIVMTEGNL